MPNGRWTAAEDAQLKEAVTQLNGTNWKAIAAFVPGRTHAQCLQRWKKALNPSLKKGCWTAEEDQLLLDTITQFQTKLSKLSGSRAVLPWSLIATKIEGRTCKHCRERWVYRLDPSINRSPFSAAEDEQILQLQGCMGNKWSVIARKLDNGRTSESVKSRFNTLANRNRRCGGGLASLVREHAFKQSVGAAKVSPAQRFKRAVVAVQAATWLHDVFSLEKLLSVDLRSIEESEHSSEGGGVDFDLAAILDLVDYPTAGSLIDDMPPAKRQKVAHTHADIDGSQSQFCGDN
jgi:hypothetical protein